MSIEKALASHPHVRDVAVVERRVGDEECAFAYVVAADDPDQATRAERAQARLRQWEIVFHMDHVAGQTHAAATLSGDPLFNHSGWTSSYTGEPIPADDMREWLDATVARILALRPRRVVEIGCGLGLVLFRVAPHCEAYVANDFSAESLQYIETYLPAELRERVRLVEAAADAADLGACDAVIINSVVQYFPTLDYLRTVLERAIAQVSDGGFVFIGDVRSFSLLTAFHLSVEMYRAGATDSIGDVCQTAQARALADRELAIDPAFFVGLQNPRISSVQIELKRGAAPTEMNRFRYDITLRVGAPANVEIQTVGWETLPALRSWLDAAPTSLRVTGIPNAWLRDEMAALELLHGEATERHWALPVEVFALADAVDYAVQLAPGVPGCFDATFARDPELLRRVTTPAQQRHRESNDPMHAGYAAELISELREHVGEIQGRRLLVFVVDNIPRLASGDVDHRALPLIV